jgi:hypothetical protein
MEIERFNSLEVSDLAERSQMRGGKIHGYALSTIGMVVMAGVVLQDSLGTQLLLSGVGFLSFFVGLLLVRTEKRKIAVDKGSRRLRLIGSAMVFLSMLLPYLPLPLEQGTTRTAYSFTDLVHKMWLGVGVEGDLSLLIFASVVFAGAAASLLHYSGGYVVLFGVTGYGYVVSLLMEVSFLQVFLTEFRAGVYVATAGGVLVVFSSLFGHGKRKKNRVEFIHESYRYQEKSPDR